VVALEWLASDEAKSLQVRDIKGTLKGNRAIIGNVDIVNL
jgi:hypothetical protein